MAVPAGGLAGVLTGTWDMAAGILPVREAGAILAGTERVQASIRKLLHGAGKTIVESVG